MDSTGLPYHRAARLGGGDRWWKPLIEGLLIVGLGLMVIAATVLWTLAVAVVTRSGPEAGSALFDRIGSSMDGPLASDPVGYAAVLLTVVVLLPLTVLARVAVGPAPLGLLSSVAGRLRWSWMLRCAVVALVVYVVLVPISVAVGHLTGHPVSPVDVEPGPVAAVLAITVLLVPLQAAAEEYAFRGYLAQAIGRWLAHPAFAVLLPVPLFVAGHEYGLVGQTDVATFAIAAGWITYRTGGLEAAIALHVVNNVVAFGLETFLGPADETWVGLAGSLVTTTAFLLVVDRLARSEGIATRTPTQSRDVVVPPVTRWWWPRGSVHR
ncbi:CPBP family intramembrane glutamic endopeptidase [Solicola sp. PLA-1-18]|uniref:CPBP family intramembrane glutamic endopeptidase n=1 Tax=Solicola sp. PLA-1-18 TaxID=3380532 RepID=UPI003B797EC9